MHLIEILNGIFWDNATYRTNTKLSISTKQDLIALNIFKGSYFLYYTWLEIF